MTVDNTGEVPRPPAQVGPPSPTPHYLPPGTLTASIRCARIVVSLYQPRVPPRWLTDHLDQLERLSCGVETKRQAAQSELDAELIGTTEAAEILECSPQYIRRIAADLDGRQLPDTTWIFDRKAVHEYATHRKEARSRAC